MIAGLAKSKVSSLKPGALIALVVALGFCFIATVLLPGLKISGDLVSGNLALKVIGEQQRYPTMIRASLDSLHDRLGTRAYIQESLDQLRDAASKLDGAVSESTADMHKAELSDLWSREREALAPLLGYSGVPYDDNESTGTVLNENGRQLERDVTAAIRLSRHALPLLDSQLTAAAGELQAANARAAHELRLFMLGGLAIAAVLVALVTLLLAARQRQDKNLRQARQQTSDILRTVKEGLFLLDEHLVIGNAYSAALETLFQRKDIEGLAFENLLKDIVSEKTLTTALKFVKVLWTERTNEKLVKSINPLGEVEVHLDVGHGRFETRYLQFDFHRVREDGKITHVLVSVADVSARVDLARELQASRSQSQAQVDTLLGILHIDPAQLTSFLNDSNAAMKMINAVLREPARDEGMFRKKLDTLFRQAHAVKGEAAALGLSSIETRAHSFEEDLKLLREKPDLSGNDFLPLVIKLDDLLTHLQSVGELVSRLSRPQPAPALGAAADANHATTDVIPGAGLAHVNHASTDVIPGAGLMHANHAGTDVIPGAGLVDANHTSADVIAGGADPLHKWSPAPAKGAAPPDTGLVGMLEHLAARVAADNDKRVVLHCVGLEAVPEDYRRVVKDIAIQAVRNALVHGIEPSSLRQVAGKPEQGHVRLTFRPREEGGYKMTIEDDGQGLATDRIKEVALEKGLITQDQAPTLDSKQIYSLLFQPGFSTLEHATKDAGRGVGMNLIADLMYQIGGKVGVASARGRYTRLTISLPPLVKPAADDTVAA